MQRAIRDQQEIVYPESDGKPMSDNTLQFDWIVLIKTSLEVAFADRTDVFVAGDLLWYPVEGEPKVRAAPDAMVAIGRPKGYRGAYLQWKEGGIAPQVVFEILSPSNTASEMRKKHAFYERYGVEEYYVYDPWPTRTKLQGYLRQNGQLLPVPDMGIWTSPRLGIRFEWGPGEALRLYHADGRPFRDLVEESKRAELEQRRAESEQRRADERERELHELKAKLRSMGIDPDTLA